MTEKKSIAWSNNITMQIILNIVELWFLFVIVHWRFLFFSRTFRGFTSCKLYILPIKLVHNITLYTHRVPASCFLHTWFPIIPANRKENQYPTLILCTYNIIHYRYTVTIARAENHNIILYRLAGQISGNK